MTKLIVIKVWLMSMFFVYKIDSIAQDITYLTGGGNFTNGETTDEEIHQINALNFYGAKRTRVSLYPSYYHNVDTQKGNPSSIDSIMILLYQGGITPMILFEYYGWYNALGSYDKWYEIGRSFAERWRPNSPYLLSKNITNLGISVYTAINEPDINNPYVPRTKAEGAENYHDALEGLADGIHSIDTSLSAILGGWASQNAFSWNDANGYDIYHIAITVLYVNPNNLSKNSSPNKEAETMFEKEFADVKSGKVMKDMGCKEKVLIMEI